MFVSGGDDARAARAVDERRRAPRIRVIVGQARQVCVERVERRGGEDARLAHAAAEPLAHRVRRVDHDRRVADEDRADRGSRAPSRSETITVSAQLAKSASGVPRRDARVPQARAVHVHAAADARRATARDRRAARRAV